MMRIGLVGAGFVTRHHLIPLDRTSLPRFGLHPEFDRWR